MRKKQKKISGNDVIFLMTSFSCDDVISGSAIFVRATLAAVVGPYWVREKAVTVIPSAPVDSLWIFTGPTGDFAGPTWGSDGLWDAKGELGRSCRHPRGHTLVP